MPRTAEYLVPGRRVRAVGVVLLAALLCAPSTGAAEDSCDAVSKELDHISAQIEDAIRPCEDMTNNPCSKEKYLEISERIKELTARGIALGQQCFGLPFSAPTVGESPDGQGAQ